MPANARSQRSAALSGIGVALLFGGGTALWALEMPDAGASGGEIVAFYRETSDRIVVGASISLVAIALFVFFASALRRLLREAEGDDLLANTAFGGALLGGGAGLAAETINMAGALRAADGELSQPLGQSLFDISQVLGFNAAGVGVGVLAVAMAAVALRTESLLPRWLAVLTAIAGLLLLTPLSRVVLGPSVLLLAVIAASLLVTPHRNGGSKARGHRGGPRALIRS
jgi:hypothetical protein